MRSAAADSLEGRDGIRRNPDKLVEWAHVNCEVQQGQVWGPAPGSGQPPASID